MQQVDTRVRSMVRIAMLSAVSIILWMPMFEIPMFLPWLKLDFSTMPALLAGFALGPAHGLIVLVIKALVHIPMGTTAGIGELADFLCSSALVLPAAFIYRHALSRNAAREDHVLRNRRSALTGMLIGVVLMVTMSVITNQFILLPMYAKFAGMEGIIAMADNPAIDSLATLFIYGVIPFNLVKGLALALVTFLLYKPLSPLLHDRSGR
ncbi:MAG: ECF transporter S component [Candidatus Fimadaptatus sp.]|jgi:riboflavin transporter FmnP